MLRKGTVPIAELILYIGTIIIFAAMVTILMGYMSSVEQARQSIEQASLTFALTSSINALSIADKGLITDSLENEYDIEIRCDPDCHIRVSSYVNDEKKEGEEMPVMAGVKPVSLAKVREYCVTKDNTGLGVKESC